MIKNTNYKRHLSVVALATALCLTGALVSFADEHGGNDGDRDDHHEEHHEVHRYKPSISRHADITADATEIDGGAYVTYSLPTATDRLDGSIPVTCSPVSGSLFAAGRTEVICSATNSANRTAHSRFKVTVRNVTSPIISLVFTSFSTTTSDAVIPADSPSGTVVTYTVSATDYHHKSFTPDQISCTPSSGSTFPLDITRIVCSINVEHHKIFEETPASVYVVDGRAPTITLRGDASISLSVGGTYTEQGADVHDAIDGDLYATETNLSGPLYVTIVSDVNTAVAGTYHVTYDAYDSNNNNATERIRTVTVSGASVSHTGNIVGGGGGGGGGGNKPAPNFGVNNQAPGAGAGTNGTGSDSNGSGNFTFTHALSPTTGGKFGSDVKQLQIFLNKHGFLVAKTGPGSPGHETSGFTPGLKAALKKFQEANAKFILNPVGLTQGTGTLGPSTMKFINSLLAGKSPSAGGSTGSAGGANGGSKNNGDNKNNQKPANTSNNPVHAAPVVAPTVTPLAPQNPPHTCPKWLCFWQ
ncbi:MAG: immunoglobulin-like domain-containing protein [Patescibacteria group bacterium]